MKEEFLNPFLGHVRQVWEKELGYTAEVSQAGLMTGRVTTEDISVVINVIGQLAAVCFTDSVATPQGRFPAS